MPSRPRVLATAVDAASLLAPVEGVDGAKRSSPAPRSVGVAAGVRSERSARRASLGVTVDGEREVLGIWWQETEGAKFWLAVLNDLRRRGVQDVLIACVDGLKGFPEASEATFPHAWVQTSASGCRRITWRGLSSMPLAR